MRNISIMGDAGDGYASHAEVRYHERARAVGNLLGHEGAGFLIAQERLGPGRIHHCMRWIGICERAFELMCARAADARDRAGQDARHQADRAGVDRREPRRDRRRAPDGAARRVDDRQRTGLYEAREQISLIKFFVAGVLDRVLDRAIQVHGALGITDDTPLAGCYRHERAARIYDGPDEVHKMVVAKRILESTACRRERGGTDRSARSAVRAGEELDARALAQFLGWDEVRVSQFPSGHSNLTYLVEGGRAQRSWCCAGRRSAPRSRRRTTWGASIASCRSCTPVYPQAPKPVAYTEDTAILGAPFYVMERIVGVILRRDPPAGLVLARDGARARRGVRRQPGDAARGRLRAPRASATSASPTATSSGRCAAGPSAIGTRAPTISRDMEFLEKWLDENMPEESGAALIHNDYKYDNLVLDAGRSDAHHRRARLGDVHRR